MAQNVKIAGASYNSVPSIQIPKVSGGYATFVDTSDANATAPDIQSGKIAYVNGAKIIGTGAGGDAKNIQAYHGMASIRTTAYTATGVKLTVAKTGTYTVSWIGIRNTNTGTSGTRLYIDGGAYGSASTTFTNTYAQAVKLTNVSLQAGQTVEVYARARSTSYYMMVGNLIIEEQ